MEQGLAAQQGQEMEMGEQGNPEQMIQQVVSMLMQGVHPDELVKQGIPVEIIKQAIQIVMAQEEQASNNMAPPATEAGLAATQAPY